MLPAPLRPQCRRNEEGAVKLAVAVTLNCKNSPVEVGVPVSKLRTAPAVPLSAGVGPEPHGTARKQPRIARLGEEFQRSEAQQRHAVSAHVTVAVGYRVDGNGVCAPLEPGFFLRRDVFPRRRQRVPDSRGKGKRAVAQDGLGQQPLFCGGHYAVPGSQPGNCINRA